MNVLKSKTMGIQMKHFGLNFINKYFRDSKNIKSHSL